MRANTLTMPICCNSEVPQNGAGMYPSRDVTFNHRASYARVKRTIEARSTGRTLGVGAYGAVEEVPLTLFSYSEYKHSVISMINF